MSGTCDESLEHSGHLKFFSALFYAGSSFLITVVNKTVLTGFRYAVTHAHTHTHAIITQLLCNHACLPQLPLLPLPGNRSGSLSGWCLTCLLFHRFSPWSSFLLQMLTTVVVLYAAKKIKTVQFQDFDRSIFLKVSTLWLPFDANFHFQGAPCIYLFIWASLLSPDLPPASALCWEQYNRTGQHQKAQVSLSAPRDEVLAARLLVCDCARVSSSLPMLTVLRKFTILMTMMLEVYVLRWAASDLALLYCGLERLCLTRFLCLILQEKIS